jgi:ABC-type amino acid transport substrate-binding protein
MSLRTTEAAEKLVLAGAGDDGSYFGRLINLIYAEAFHRTGVQEIETVVYPLKRAAVMANSGDIDGELLRTMQYADSAPNLIRVEESPISIMFSACAADPTIKVDNWESLKGSNLRVDYRRGAVQIQMQLAQYLPQENISEVNDPLNAMKKLLAGRSDLYVDADEGIQPLLQTDEFKGKIHHAGVIQEIPLYAYLHNKHADLVPKLEAALKAMKEEGLIEELKAKAAE